MDNKEKIKISIPRYQQIAFDIASKIADGKYKVGDKLYARSSLAGQYGVSSETARRAICLLADLNIVVVEKGSGITVASYENALKFYKQSQELRTINDIKDNIMQSVKRQNNEMKELSEYLNELISRIEHFRSVNPFMPYQIKIEKETAYLNKTIGDINFWQNTGATVIAVKRAEELLVSPGPYTKLEENDILYFVGRDDVIAAVKNFLYPNEANE